MRFQNFFGNLFGAGFLQRFGKCGPMDIAGKMDRTLAIDGVPSGWIGGAKILHLQSDTDVGAINVPTHNFGGCFPGRSARCATQHLNPADLSMGDFSFELRRSKTVAVFAQTNLPGKAASGRWCHHMLTTDFFPGCNHRDIIAAAQLCQIFGQIRMLQKIQNHVSFQVRR